MGRDPEAVGGGLAGAGSASAGTSAAPVAADAPPDASRLRILVIDDEPLCCRLLQRLLGRQHDVIVMETPAEALHSVRSGNRYDVILCDLSMPGPATAAQLFHTLLAEHPDQARRFAIISGGPTTREGAELVAELGDRVAWKPYTADELRRFCSQLIGARA